MSAEPVGVWNKLEYDIVSPVLHRTRSQMVRNISSWGWSWFQNFMAPFVGLSLWMIWNVVICWITFTTGNTASKWGWFGFLRKNNSKYRRFLVNPSQLQKYPLFTRLVDRTFGLITSGSAIYWATSNQLQIVPLKTTKIQGIHVLINVLVLGV